MNTIDILRLDLSLRAKNGVNFITAASIIWFIMAIIWALEISSYEKSIFTFIAGALMLPLAFLFSNIFKTEWQMKNNRLSSPGLWLNFAQLFYFPFLIFILIQNPDYFIMTYAIITGAHFFPYAWFYDEKIYAFSAGFIVVITMFLGLYLPVDKMYFLPLFMSIVLLTLSVMLYVSFRRKRNANAFTR